MKTTLFVSPHLDDAAYSCGGLIARLANEGWRCVVATVFTRSAPNPQGFALECQLDKGLSADVDYMALRRGEDAACMAVLGAEPLWLDLPEAPRRGYDSAPELFAGVKPRDRGTAGEVEAALASLIDRLEPDALFAPQGLGDHVDHLHVVRAAQSVSKRHELPVAWWRDLPYAIRKPEARAPLRLGENLQPVTVPVDDTLRRKIDACAAYVSQNGFQFGGEAKMREALAAEKERMVAARRCRGLFSSLF